MKSVATFVVLALVFLALVAAGVSTFRPGQTAAEIAAAEDWAADVITLRMMRSAMRDRGSYQLDQVLRLPDKSLCVTYRSRDSRIERAIITRDGGAAHGNASFVERWNHYCDGESAEDISHIQEVLVMLAMHEVDIKLSERPDGLGFIYGRARLGDRTVRVDIMPPDYLWEGDIKPGGEHAPDPTHWCVYADGELLARIEREEDVGVALVPLLASR